MSKKLEPEWYIRLIKEKDELAERIEKLKAFIGTDSFNDLYIVQRSLMTLQLTYMESYLEVLVARYNNVNSQNGKVVPR